MRNNKFSHISKSPVLSLIALILFVGIVIFVLSGCSSSSDAYENNELVGFEDSRFTAERFDVPHFGDAYIITDSATGVQYLFYRQGSQAGLTKLETGE